MIDSIIVEFDRRFQGFVLKSYPRLGVNLAPAPRRLPRTVPYIPKVQSCAAVTARNIARRLSIAGNRLSPVKGVQL